MAIAQPCKRNIVNPLPTDLPKASRHSDSPIALVLFAAIEIIQRDATKNAIAPDKSLLDGTLVPMRGALTATMPAAASERVLI